MFVFIPYNKYIVSYGIFFSIDRHTSYLKDFAYII